MKQGTRQNRSAVAPQPQGFGMFVLRLWMWAVPVMMLIASVAFAGVAIAAGRWALLGVMVFMGCIAVSLLVFHWWVLYRFGSRAQ
jgi:hypothetical protein